MSKLVPQTKRKTNTSSFTEDEEGLEARLTSIELKLNKITEILEEKCKNE